MSCEWARGYSKQITDKSVPRAPSGSFWLERPHKCDVRPGLPGASGAHQLAGRGWFAGSSTSASTSLIQTGSSGLDMPLLFMTCDLVQRRNRSPEPLPGPCANSEHYLPLPEPTGSRHPAGERPGRWGRPRGMFTLAARDENLAGHQQS